VHCRENSRKNNFSPAKKTLHTNDFKAIIFYCAPHNNFVDNSTILPIIKVMVRRNIEG
jgi:hypothetical protein